MNQFVILNFGIDPLNWPSLIEIGEIAGNCKESSKRYGLQFFRQRDHANNIIYAMNINYFLLWSAYIISQ